MLFMCCLNSLAVIVFILPFAICFETFSVLSTISLNNSSFISRFLISFSNYNKSLFIWFNKPNVYKWFVVLFGI